MKFPVRLALVVAAAVSLVIGTLAIPSLLERSDPVPSVEPPAPAQSLTPQVAPVAPVEIEPAPAETAPATGDWTLDLSAKAIPQDAASGKLYGHEFVVRDAAIQNNVLTLMDGDVFEFQGKFFVFLFLRDGNESLSGRTISIGTKMDWEAPVAAHVHVHSRKDDGSSFETDAKTDGFAMELRFGQLQDGKIPGSIYLCYPDDHKSYVAGTFVATVE